MNPEIKFTSEGKEFYFNVREQVNKVTGDSGIGKTFFFSKLKKEISISKRGLVEYPVKDINTKKNIETLVLNVEEFKEDDTYREISTFKGDLIILDEADMLLNISKRIVDFINNSNKYFILVTRSSTPGLIINLSAFAKILYENSRIVIKYRVRGRWI